MSAFQSTSSGYIPLGTPGERLSKCPSPAPSYNSIPDSDPPDEFIVRCKDDTHTDVFTYFQSCFSLITGILIIISIYTLFIIKPGQLPSLPLPTHQNKLYSSNGTHTFDPTVIMISIDGFRAEYLSRGISPNMQNLANKGTRAKHMIPSFPTITFPNHFTLVTGLYPDSHGIVGNTFFDPNINKTFNYKTSKSNLEDVWWGGEPIWITAEAQGQKSAIHMWPGSEVAYNSIKPSYLEPFSKSFTLEKKMDQILGWLDLPQEHRPTFIGAYIFDVDTAGHNHGPNSAEVNNAIKNVDKAFGELLDGLLLRNLTDIVNIMVVSDHGMAEVHTENTIHLDDYIDMNQISSHHIAPYAGFTPKREEDLEEIYLQLKNASSTTDLWDVYKKDEIPNKFNYGHNERVPPIFCIQKSGWAFGTRKVYAHLEQDDRAWGLHGYDNIHPDMHAVFIGHGPSFKSKPILDPFKNVEIYNLISTVLGLNSAPNNGTMNWATYNITSPA